MATGCIASAVCRSAYHSDALRIHLVADDNAAGDYHGSWLGAALADGILSCKSGSASPRRSLVFILARHEVFDQDETLRLRPTCGPDMPFKNFSESVKHLPSLSLDAVMRSIPANSIVGVSWSTPDVGKYFVSFVGSWMSKRGVNPATRGLMLHYRDGRLPRDWQEKLPSSPAAPGYPLEVFWSTYWRKLTWEAMDGHQRACARRELAVNAWCEDGWRGLGPNGGRIRAANICGSQFVSRRLRHARFVAVERSATTDEALSERAAARPLRSFLLLGGDAHAGRPQLLHALFNDGLLGDALWSLSRPKECETPPSTWVAWCALLPHRLDVAMLGDADDSTGKDSSFAEPALYANTHFSLTLESMSDYDKYTSFLTEKVLKPIYGGHPFILQCAAPGALSTLRSWGFRTFAAGGFNESYDAARQPSSSHAAHDDRKHCTAETTELRSELHKLIRLSRATDAASVSLWSEALAAADHNRRHLVCADGLHRQMQAHAKRILNFVWAPLSKAAPLHDSLR